MEAFFNEISTKYIVANKHTAQARMEDFINLLRKTKENGFSLCRVENNFESNSLCEGYTIHHWLDDPEIQKDYKNFYLAFRKYPYETGVEEEENEFIAATYYLDEPHEPNFNGSVTTGLAWAFVCNTLAISFPANPVWQKPEINLSEDKNGFQCNVTVNHAGNIGNMIALQQWIASTKTLVLRPSGIEPEKKNIHLSDDHGKDKLLAAAKKLARCPYVVEIPHSLPYDRFGRSFIRKIYPNGRIDVTLIDEDDGYGMIIQTTGRNLRETQAIADILKEMY